MESEQTSLDLGDERRTPPGRFPRSRTKPDPDKRAAALAAWNCDMAAQGYCVNEKGYGCGWRNAHSPRCPLNPSTQPTS